MAHKKAYSRPLESYKDNKYSRAAGKIILKNIKKIIEKEAKQEKGSR